MTKIDKNDLFLSVIESNKGIIYKIANSYCRSQEDRHDLVQEITLKLWQSFDTYNNEFKHSTWIYRIALNTAISYYRKEKVREKYVKAITPSLIAYEDIDASRETEHPYILLQQFIAGLKEMDKAIMLLYLEDKSYAAIAEIMGISETNAGTKISRLKGLLKEKFNQQNL